MSALKRQTYTESSSDMNTCSNVPLDGKTQEARLCCTIDDLCASPRVYEI